MKCAINVRKFIPQAREDFTTFECNDFQSLLLELDRIIQFIHSNHPNTFFAIPVQITAAKPELVPHSLLKFIKSQEQILFHIHIENAPELQIAFDNAYLEAQKNWYALQIEKQREGAAMHLEVLCLDEDERSLSYIQTPELPTEELQDLIEWSANIPQNILPSQPFAMIKPQSDPKLAAFLRTLENASQSDTSYGDIISAFSEILGILFNSLGEKGLYYRLNQLKVLDVEQLHHLSAVMFTPTQTENIQILAHPNFEYYLEIISLWPKNLFFNWLTWYAQRSDEMGLIESIEKIQAFWLDAFDYHPLIPRLAASPTAISFSQLIENFSRLLDRTAAEWKKVQLKFIFQIDWSEPQAVFRLKESQNLNWISSEILIPSHPLHHSYLYLAKYLSSPEEETFKLIQTHLQSNQGHPQRLRLITWLYTLKPHLPTEAVHSIIESYANPKDICDLLYAIPSRQVFSSVTFLEMHQGHLEDLLAIHALWLAKNTQAIQYSWAQWMNFFHQIEHPKALELIALNDKSIGQIYFYLILHQLSEDMPSNSPILVDFANLPEDAQKRLIQAFLSLEDKNTSLDLEAISRLIIDPELLSNMEPCFKTHLPANSFGYFNKATQFETVLNTLKSMLSGLSYVLDCFSNEQIKALKLPGYSPSFKTCLQEGLVSSLQSTKTQIDAIQILIQELETNQSTEAFQNLLDLFNQFETFIQTFLKTPLLGNLADFLMAPRLLLGNKSFISLFDESLQNPGKTFKNLFEVMAWKFDELKKVGIDQYFNKEVIQLIAAAQPLENTIELLMNKNLIQVISSKIPQTLETEKHQDLLGFLGKIQLNLQEIEQFFQRIKVIEYVNQQWPILEAQLRRKNISHQNIWTICVKHQCVNALPYASTHWKICFELIQKFHEFPQFEELLDKILQVKNKLPKKLDFEGQIDHPHWEFTLDQLQADLQSERAQSPHFFLMLEHAIDYHLQTGKALDYEQFTVVFQKIREDARSKIMHLTSIRDAEKAPFITAFLGKIRQILSESSSKAWIKLIEKILLDENLENNLAHIPSILIWLEQESHFPWLETIIQDTDSNLTDILLLIQNFQNMSPAWRDSYPRRPGLVSEPSISVSLELEVLPPPKANKASLITSAWSFITHLSAVTSIDPIELQQIRLNPRPTIAAPQALNEQTVYAWQLWQRPFRPSVRMLSHWLSQPPNDATQRQLTDLDIWPLGAPQSPARPFDDAQIQQVQKDLESHTKPWAPGKKKALMLRLNSVMTHFNAFYHRSVTDLLKNFQTLKLKLASTTEYSTHLEDEIIGILIALYYKNLAKMPYPTQIMCLLLTLEFGDKNLIFEVDTGEGKSIINALLAVLKMIRKENNTVIVRTANAPLVHQDFYQKKHYQFFKLLGIHCHELLEMSDMAYFQEGGIYYSSNLQFQILSTLSPSLQNQNFDLIADEVDEILDQQFSMSLAKPHPKLKNMSWLYEDVNEFIDAHLDGRHTPDGWVKMLQKFILEKNKFLPKHLQQIRVIHQHDKIWMKLLKGGFLSKKYLHDENQTFIIKTQTTTEGHRYSIVPYANGKPILDFYFGLDGLLQCLAQRISAQRNIELLTPDFCIPTTYLNPFHYKNITSLVGLSGSNGKVIELNQLTRAFNAESFRIGRFTKKNLSVLTSILTSGQNVHIEHLTHIVMGTAQPILILCQDIESAYSIFLHLPQQTQSHKSFKLLTGQESDSDRENWLYNQEAEKFAGQNHCITIGTSALGRGIDITPTHPQGLMVIKTYLEKNERTETQLNGRPARAGAKGSIISILNRKALIQHFPEQKPWDIRIDTLDTFKAALQKHTILVNTKQRLTEQLKQWCWTQLCIFLNQSLTLQADIELCYPYLLNEFNNEWQKLNTPTSHSREFYLDWLMKVWRQALLLIHIRGLEQKNIPDDVFRRQMRLSDWQEIINPDLQTTSFFAGGHAASHTLSLSPSDSQFFDIQAQYLKSLSAPSKSNWYFSWLNFPAQQISNYLYESWEFFKTNPSSENFKYFYESLLAAKLLYQEQKKSTFLRIDYWFISLNILLPWLELEQKLSNQLQIQNIHQLADKNFTAVEQTLAAPLDNLFSVINPKEYLANSPSLKHFLLTLKNFLISLWNRFMLFFYPEPKKHYDRIQSNIIQFKNQKNLQNLKKLHESFSDFLSFYYQMETAPWYFIPKYYWKMQFNTWKKEIESYFSDLPQEIDSSKAFTSWLNDCSIHADFRLKCLGHLLHQEETLTRQQSFFTNLCTTDKILMTLHRQYLETSPDHTDIKLHEFGRFFKKELQQKWMSTFHTGEAANKPLSDKMASQSEYTELAKNMIGKHIQNQLSQSQLLKPSIRLRVLENELSDTERNREFLPLLRKA
jgi:hypothetical protein